MHMCTNKTSVLASCWPQPWNAKVILKGVIGRLGKYSYLLLCWELDDLTSLRYLWSDYLQPFIWAQLRIKLERIVLMDFSVGGQMCLRSDRARLAVSPHFKSSFMLSYQAAGIMKTNKCMFPSAEISFEWRIHRLKQSCWASYFYFMFSFCTTYCLVCPACSVISCRKCS